MLLLLVGFGGALPSASLASERPWVVVSYASDVGVHEAASGFDTGVHKPTRMRLHLRVRPDVPMEVEYQASCRGNGESDGVSRTLETTSTRIELPILVPKPKSCVVYAFGAYKDRDSSREVRFRLTLRAKQRPGAIPPELRQSARQDRQISMGTPPRSRREPRLRPVRALVRAATARDGEKACALVTAEGRSVIDAPTQSGREACVKSVEDFDDDEVDVRLVKAHTLRHTPSRAAVAAVLKEDGTKESWVLRLVHRHRGWLVDNADLRD